MRAVETAGLLKLLSRKRGARRGGKDGGLALAEPGAGLAFAEPPAALGFFRQADRHIDGKKGRALVPCQNLGKFFHQSGLRRRAFRPLPEHENPACRAAIGACHDHG
jgi:hypothetical protein